MADGYSFVATPTMRDFMLAPDYVRVLAGPIGGGKSVACIHELIRWATTQAPDRHGKRRTRFLVVRNTVDQLRSTTLKSIVDWFPPTVYGKYIATEKTLQYKFSLADKTTVETEWMLVSLEDPNDVRKALGLECTGLWGNECRELHPEVVDGLLMRVNRFPSMKDGGATRAGAIFDTNMPGAETWWSEKMENPPENWSVHTQPTAVLPLAEYLEVYKDEPDPFLVAKDALGAEYVINPAADNLKNLAKDYYQQTLSGKSEDFINIYLRCQFGRTLSGLPVFDQTFRASTHVAKTPYTAIRSDNYPLCIGMDMGRTPAAVIMQATPMGQTIVLSEVVTEASNSMGMQTFLKTVLVPHLNQHYPGMARYVAPDPAGWQRSQGNEKAPVDYIREAGFTVVRPQTNKTSLRLEVIDKALGQAADARPRFQINPGCKTLIKAFRGAYKWAVNKKGDLTNESEPIKSHPYSDVCFVAGTLVATSEGDTPIEQLQIGDAVLGPEGVDVVAAVGARIAETLRIQMSDGRELVCTPDHPFATGEKNCFIRADALRYGSLVVDIEDSIWRRGQNPTQGSALWHGCACIAGQVSRLLNGVLPRGRQNTVLASATATGSAGNAAWSITGFGLEKTREVGTSGTSGTTEKGYRSTGMFGRRQTGRFQTGLWCITSTIRSITARWETLSLWGRPSMQLCTGWSGAMLGPSARKGLTPREKQQSSGTSPMLGEHGTAVLQKRQRHAQWFSSPKRAVNTAARHTSSSASQDAPWRNGMRAPLSVCSISFAGSAKVFNITTSGSHQFYANGVLVHNCDALGYALLVIDGNHAGSRQAKRREVVRARAGGWT